MNKGIICGILLSACLFTQNAQAERVIISTEKTSLVLDAAVGGNLNFAYYGEKINSHDADLLFDAGQAWKQAYPVYGMQCQSETALSVTHSDGNMTLQMKVQSVEKNGDVTRIKMKDIHYPFYIDVCYKTYPGKEIIETWAEYEHTEKGIVKLNQFASAYLPIRYGQVWISHLYGSWANEGRVEEEPLRHGMMEIKNKDGVRNSHTDHAEVMFSLDGKPQENTGRVIGAALCYSGNYKLRIDTDDSNYHHFFAGINEDNSQYNLKSGERFVTPALALTYSNEGLSGASRHFHSWARSHKIAHGTELRPILLNSWEGVYFNINEEGMDQMMNDISSMGGELFVMDDGWFGMKYHRDNDSYSLGDWTVDTRKLPHGIQGLIDTAKKHNIKFGIWIEPEMTNSKSELYEKHPEYIIAPTYREPVQGRGGTQLVLDMSNPKVQDLVFHIVDTLLTNYPELYYIKWDANAPVMNHGSQYLTKDRQSHLYIEYHRGFEKVCQRIRAKYPNVIIQACASGGGRANYGVLPYFDEFWVSDDTDALQRIYMQWGTSYFFPAVTMASHISAAPNHQTFRTIPLKFRIDVAMSGRLGMEIQPKNMTEKEKALCKQAIKEYKQIRPIVQQGDIYRLLSPYEKLGCASMMYVKPDKSEAVFYWWKTETFCNQQLPRIPMAGLDPQKNYRVKELHSIDQKPLAFEGKVFSGAFLMANGLDIPLEHDLPWNERIDYASRVLYLVAE